MLTTETYQIGLDYEGEIVSLRRAKALAREFGIEIVEKEDDGVYIAKIHPFIVKIIDSAGYFEMSNGYTNITIEGV